MNELENTPADKNYKPSGISKAEEAAREVYTYTFQGMDDLIGLFLAGYKLAEKDLALTIQDLELLHTFLYAVKNNKQGMFTFTRLTDEQYAEVLKRYKEARK